jgi:hypothetical protein
MSRSLFRALALSLLMVAPAGLVPTPAQADAGQLCRSVSTVLFAPTDIIVAPYAIYADMSIGFEDYSDHWMAITAGTVPGIAFLGFMQVGGALFRVVAGALEVVPGVVTLFRSDSPKPLFTSLEDAWADYSTDIGPCPIRAGVHWNSLNF